MPASLPGSTLAQNLDNPSAGKFVIFDPLSGPKGSPLDVRKIDSWSAGTPVYENDAANQTPSTGALQTGIGFGSQVISQQNASSPIGIFKSGFNDNGIPGEVPTYSAPPPNGVVASNAINSTRMYIGGGRTITDDGANIPGAAGCDPYEAGVAICGAGNSGVRDGGAGPDEFTGFPLKAVTASGTVANGAAIEAGFTNRSGVSMVSGQSGHGVSTTELAAAS